MMTLPVENPSNPHPQPEPVDWLITGGSLVTMNGRREVIENGAVAVRGNQIVLVGTADEVGRRVIAANRVDAKGQVVFPGLVNAHSHLAMTLFRGLVDDQPLEAWLERVWPLEAIFATPENTRLGTQLAIAEMIRGGITCAADMYWQLFENTRAAREAGFRLVNGPAFTEIIGPGGVTPHNSQSRARAFLEEFSDDQLIQSCIQAHSIYTTSPEMLEQARLLAEEYRLTFITHASESWTEVETSTARFGKTPIEYLHSLGLLGPHTLLAHCVHLRDDEIGLLKDTGTSVAHCPESNMKLGNGIAPVPSMLKAGVNVALGTDGASTNNDLDMLGEMRMAALLHKGVLHDPMVMKAEDVFSMATVHGARAFGLGERIGSLEAGKLADIALLSLEAPHMTPHYNLYSHLVYSAGKNDVTHVMIHGKLVMQDRRLLTLDEESIKSQVRELAKKIAAK